LCTLSLKAVLLILGAHLAFLDLIAVKVSNHNCHHQNQAASSLVYLVILRNIHASLFNKNSCYSISFDCGCGVHCIGCFTDHLYCGPDCCKLQVSFKDTFSMSVYKDAKHSFLSVHSFTIVGIKRTALQTR